MRPVMHIPCNIGYIPYRVTSIYLVPYIYPVMCVHTYGINKDTDNNCINHSPFPTGYLPLSFVVCSFPCCVFPNFNQIVFS